MRGVPVQYCPYCGEEDLRPREEQPDEELSGAWECADCRATFLVRRTSQAAQAAGGR